MVAAYGRGVAIIGEGATEVVFYEEYLKCKAREKAGQGYSFFPIDELGERAFVLYGPDKPTLIKMLSTDTVTQIPNSYTWFESVCVKKHPDLFWSVALAYDLEGYERPITPFYEGDWRLFRERIEPQCIRVIDLASKADIEDIMLTDFSGVLSFLGLPPDTQMPTGGKGKTKMKKLFRIVAPNNAYRSGEKARPLMQALNMKTIEDSGLIPLDDFQTVLGIV